MEDKKIYLTKEGLEKIKKEYEALKKIRLAKTAGQEAPKIWESEDVNLEYLSFEEDLEFLETKLAEFDYIIKNAQIITKPPKEKRNLVCMGATVTLQEEDRGGAINEFVIVGSLEANPNEGKISADSPVGKALLGKAIGEKVVITSPIEVIYRIKDIKYEIA
jgi:transcription elongation factor GreA